MPTPVPWGYFLSELPQDSSVTNATTLGVAQR
jgi:hypothetical protein